MTNTSNVKRNESIELFRILLMFLICLLHSFQFGIAPNAYWRSGLMWAVCGFVFISGWFGVRFSLSKWLRILLLGVVCGGIAIGLAKCLGLSMTLKQMSYILFRQWFLCAYLMLMLFAPFLNVAFSLPQLCGSGVISSLVILVVWNWLGSLNPMLKYGPHTDGMGPFTFLMMIEVYAIGRIARVVGGHLLSFSLLSDTKNLIALAFVNLVILVFGWRLRLGMYCSPFAMSMAALMFTLFNRIRLAGPLKKMVLFVSPSMFSIYLLHSHVVGSVCIENFQKMLESIGISQYCFIPLSAIFVFGCCLTIDLVRRGLLFPIRKWLGLLYANIDQWIAKVECIFCVPPVK